MLYVFFELSLISKFTKRETRGLYTYGWMKFGMHKSFETFFNTRPFVLDQKKFLISALHIWASKLSLSIVTRKYSPSWMDIEYDLYVLLVEIKYIGILTDMEYTQLLRYQSFPLICNHRQRSPCFSIHYNHLKKEF